MQPDLINEPLANSALQVLTLLADAFEAGADAAEFVKPCRACSAVPGQRCRTLKKGEVLIGRIHLAREPGDVDLAMALRAMARSLRAALPAPDLERVPR